MEQVTVKTFEHKIGVKLGQESENTIYKHTLPSIAYCKLNLEN